MTVGRYATPLVAVAAATLIRLPLQTVLGSDVPYLLFFPAIAFTAWYSGLGPGLLATALSGAVALFLYIPPFESFRVASPEALVSMALFLAIGTFLSYLSEALRDSQQRTDAERATLKAALLSIGDGVIVSDRDGRITLMNTVAEQLTGWTLQAAEGRFVREVFHIVSESTHEPVEDPVRQVLTEGRIVSRADHTTLIARNGTSWPIDDSGAPVRDAADAIIGVVIVFRHIAEQRRADAERTAALARERELRVEAESANRTKDEFLTTLSHELRTPLNAILGWARMLGDPSVPREQRDRAIAVIQRNAEAQSALIADLLDMSRFMTGKMRLSFQSVELAEVIADAVDAVRVAAEAKQISLEVAADRSVGSIAGDPDRLRQLVWNLLLNAVKFTPRLGHIAIALERSDSHVILRIRDSGIGIAADLMPRIFDRFTQGDASMSRVYGGLGLGLALVRQIAEAHGGLVTAESQGAGTGTAFTVSLPVFVGEMHAVKPVRGTDEEPIAPAFNMMPSLAGTRVLVVEDDEDGRDLMDVSLAALGAEVRSADSVDAALSLLAVWRPTVIVTDIGMPVQDGFAFRRRLRETGDETPMIALTGYTAAGDRSRVREAGFVTHVSKPVDLRTLIDAIHSATGRAGRVAGTG
jgi:PAS domain S-box-containing protein